MATSGASRGRSKRNGASPAQFNASATDVPKKSKPADPYAEGHDVLLINRDVTEGLLSSVMQCVSASRKNDRLILVTVTYGGLANEAYRVARYLQTVYEEITAFVPTICKSAGTLIVASSNKVVISPFGEIGPLDVQLLPKDEIFGRRSGLTTRWALSDLKTHAFETFEHFMYEIIRNSNGAVSFKLAAEISAKISSEVLSRVYEQINPDALGQDFRDLNVATKYCERLNKKARNLKPGGIRRLVYDYPSHDFVIDFEEAKEIFERVSLPSQALYTLMLARMKDMMTPRTGKSGVVEMLTIDGQPLVAEKPADAPNKARKPTDATPPRPDQRNAAGTGREA